MGSLVKQIFVLVSVFFLSSRLFEDGHKLTGQDSRPPTTQSPSLRVRSGLGPTLPQAARPGRPVALAVARSPGGTGSPCRDTRLSRSLGRCTQASPSSSRSFSFHGIRLDSEWDPQARLRVAADRVRWQPAACQRNRCTAIDGAAARGPT